MVLHGHEACCFLPRLMLACCTSPCANHCKADLNHCSPEADDSRCILRSSEQTGPGPSRRVCISARSKQRVFACFPHSGLDQTCHLDPQPTNPRPACQQARSCRDLLLLWHLCGSGILGFASDIDCLTSVESWHFKAECLALPAAPLTLSSGYLFGATLSRGADVTC